MPNRIEQLVLRNERFHASTNRADFALVFPLNRRCPRNEEQRLVDGDGLKSVIARGKRGGKVATQIAANWQLVEFGANGVTRTRCANDSAEARLEATNPHLVADISRLGDITDDCWEMLTSRPEATPTRGSCMRITRFRTAPG